MKHQPEDEKTRAGKESSLETLRRHRIVRVKRQNEKLRLDLKKTKGELVPLEKIKHEVLAANAVVKQQLLSLPFRLGSQLAGTSDPRECSKILEVALVQCLNDLAYGTPLKTEFAPVVARGGKSRHDHHPPRRPGPRDPPAGAHARNHPTCDRGHAVSGTYRRGHAYPPYPRPLDYSRSLGEASGE
jgi:hypothetical protein